MNQKARNRLLRDLKEIENNPLETVYAQPLPNNLFVWYATVLAPQESLYHGIILNIKLEFPEDYPNSPPKAICYPYITHKHVFSSFICLDMLTVPILHGGFSASGWSSSYSCLSIILQLQSFLLEEEDPKKRSSIEWDVNRSKEYSNHEIGHSPQEGKIWPCAPHWKVEEIIKSKYDGLWEKEKTNVELIPGVDMSLEDYVLLYKKTPKKKQQKKKQMGKSSNNDFGKIEHLKDFPNEMLIHILKYLNFLELKRVSNSSNYLKRICENRVLSTERELICFHSKTTYNEDTLGIGLSFHTKENGMLESISTPLDLISKTTFYEDGVNKSVWRIVTSHWLPVYLNRKHGKFEELKQAVSLIKKTHKISNSTHLEGPDIYIDLMCKLMNSMVVEIMKENTHASIKALYGYLYFHRWLIFIVEKFPQALENIQQQVRSFVMEEDSRKKSACTNIGEFLPKLSVLGPSGLTWDYVKSAVIEESTIRKQLWNIKQFPMLANPYDKDDELRCSKSWEANNVSCKLMMFHVFFLRNVVEVYNDLSLEELGRLYDNNFGCPPKAKDGRLLEDVLQQEVFKIQRISSFEHYFNYVGLTSLNTKGLIADYLRKCVKISEKRGYHVNYHRINQQKKKASAENIAKKTNSTLPKEMKKNDRGAVQSQSSGNRPKTSSCANIEPNQTFTTVTRKHYSKRTTERKQTK